MKKPKFNFRTHVWPKYVISAGVLAAATAITLGSLYGCAKNSDEKLGKAHTGNPKDFKNYFVSVDKAESNFVTTDKSKKVAKFDFAKNQVIKENGQAISVDEFLDQYYREHHNLPFLNIKYGSFNFYNEYIEAVSPLEFQKFTNWFMTNVSWGPEIITLKSFSIVKGVEMHGNSITLGAHSSKNKELTTIKFYPDAFFGTLPIYSELSGAGNAQDSLVYKVNQKLLTSEQLKDFLANISNYNAISNYSKTTLDNYGFRNLLDYRTLINQKVWVIEGNWKEQLKQYTLDNIELSRLMWANPYLTLIQGKDEETARKNLLIALEKYKNTDEFNIIKNIAQNVKLVQKTITNIHKGSNPIAKNANIMDSYLNITFEDGTSFDVFNNFEDITHKNPKNEWVKNDKVVNIARGYNESLERINLLKEEFINNIRKIANKNVSEEEINNYVKAVIAIQPTIQEITKLNETKAQLDEEFQEQENFKAQVAKFEEEITDKQNKVVQKETKLSEVKQKITQKNNEIKDLEEQLKSDPLNQDLKDKLAKTKEQQEKLVKERNELFKEINNFKNNINATKKQLQNVKNKLWKFITQKAKEDKLKETKETIDAKVKSTTEEIEKDSKIEKNQTPEALNALRSLAQLIHDFYEEKDVKLHKQLDESTEDLVAPAGKNIYTYKKELANKFDLIHFEYNEKIKKITTPYFDGKAYETVKFVPYSYYTTDIAYLPNQLIAIDSLVDISRLQQINWRNFYNLDGYIRSKNIDEISNNDGFYVYTKNVSSLEEDFNKNNPDLKYKIEYSKTIKNRKELQNKQKQLMAWNTEFTELISKRIKSLFTPFITKNETLPENYLILGNHGDYPLTKFNIIEKFDQYDSKNILEYIDIVYNGLSTATNPHHKEGYKKYYTRIEEKIKAGDATAFNLYSQLKALQVKRFEIIEKQNDPKEDKTLLQAQLLSITYQFDQLKKQWEETHNKVANKSWYISTNQLILLCKLDLNLQTAKKIAELHQSLINEYKQKRLELETIERKIKLENFKILYMTQTANFADPVVIEQYNRILHKFEENINTHMLTYIAKVVDEQFKAADLKGKQVLEILKNPTTYNQVSIFISEIEKTNRYFKDFKNKVLLSQAELVAKIQVEVNSDENLYNLNKKFWEDLKAEYTPLIKPYNDAFEVDMTYEIEENNNKKISVTKKAKERMFDSYAQEEDELNQVATHLTNKISTHQTVLDNINAKINQLQVEYKDPKITAERKVEIIELLKQIAKLYDNTKTAIYHINDVLREIKLAISNLLEIKQGITNGTHTYLDAYDLDSNLLSWINEINSKPIWNIDKWVKTLINGQLRRAIRERTDWFKKEIEQKLNIAKKAEKLDELKGKIKKAENELAPIKERFDTKKAVLDVANKIETSLYKEAINKEIESTLAYKASENSIKNQIEFFSNLMPDYSKIINGLAKNSEIGNMILGLNIEVEKSCANDPLIKKLNNVLKDLDDPNSEINKFKEKAQNAYKTAGLKDQLDNIESEKSKYGKMTDSFIKLLNDTIKVKILSNYIKNESIDIESYVKNTNNEARLADTKDAVTWIIKNVKGIHYQLELDKKAKLEEIANQLKKIKTLTIDLIKKTEDILGHKDVVNCIDKINSLFNQFVIKSSGLISPKYINDPVIKAHLEIIDKSRIEAIEKSMPKLNQDEKLVKYEAIINEGFQKTIDKLYNIDENLKTINLFDNAFERMAISKDFIETRTYDWAKFCYFTAVKVTKDHLDNQDANQINNLISQNNAEINSINKREIELDKIIKEYDQKIKATTDLNEKKRLNKERGPFALERDRIRKKRNEISAHNTYLNNRLKANLFDAFNKAKTTFGPSELFVGADLHFDITKALNKVQRMRWELFNKAVDDHMKQTEKILKYQAPISNFFNEFNREYLTLLNPNIVAFEKIANSKIASIKTAIGELINARIREILISGREFPLYDSKNNGFEYKDADSIIVAKSRSELIDILSKKKLVNANDSVEKINKDIYFVRLSHLKKDGTKLVVTLRNILTDEKEMFANGYSDKYIKFNIDASVNDKRLSTLNALFTAANYKKQVTPTLIREEGNIRDENGKSVKGYSVFVDAYQDMTEKLLHEVPYAGEWLEGEHLVSKLNEKGEIEYTVENGRYLGFTKDSRVGLWAILKMTDPNFKGISTDFLKFVGAHEYGHHITLNGAHDLGNKGNNPIYVSALTPGATPHIDNYYSKDALEKLYLKARTHLELNTTRLLKENNVVIDYGEYITFGIPKIEIVNGKPNLIYKNENEENIWGTKLNKDDIIATLKNNKRRFLQNFKGLLEAVIARRQANGLDGDYEKYLTAFDLWLMNSLDHHSGTINPSLRGGTAKYMVWDKTEQRYVFKPGSLEILKGILKDGKGNIVEFEEVNGELLPKVVEGVRDAKGNYVIINKVLMFNEDGTPVINVPLHVDFNDKSSPYYDANAIKYVNSKIKAIIETIKSLIVEKYSINGWDTTATDLSLEPKFILSNLYLSTLLGKNDDWVELVNNLTYKAFVNNRNNNTGELIDDSKPLPYFDNSGKLIYPSNKKIPQASIYANIKKYALGIKRPEDLTSLMFAMNTAGDSFNNVVNSGEGHILYVDKDHQYLPNINLVQTFENNFLYNYVADMADVLQLKKIMKWYSKFTPEFIGNNKNKHLWFAKDKNGETLKKLPALGEIHEVSKMSINEKIIEKDPVLSLFNAFYSIEGSQKLFGKDVAFTDYKKFLEFVSVDLKQAKLDKNTKVVNWNIDYVKGKVDFSKFIAGLRLAIDEDQTLEAKEKEAYTKLIHNNNEQEIANEIMFRFSYSNLGMLMSNITIQDLKDNNDYGWIFDQNNGYGDLSVSTLNTINPDINKFEISLEQYIKTYEAKAQEWSAQLNQFNLFDALIFDGKTSCYTSQTVGNMLESKNSVYGLLLTLGKGIFKKAKPSQDVLDYYGSKTERKFNEFFTDYTYNFAEVINRDNLQITYSPSNSNFGNMPSYLSNLSESNTGLEYVVDGAATSRWLDLLINFRGDKNGSGVRDTILNFEKMLNEEARRRSQILNTRFIERVFANQDNMQYGQNYKNNYFGQFKTINNGWFKDRWYRDFLDFKLYDDQGKDIKDDTIRIKDLTGTVVKTRARAYWQYYIQSQGVGRRNITSIWRDSDKDAVAMFGYLSTAIADKANYLAFKNVRTGEVKTLRITKQNASNMFYYKEQQVNNEIRHQNGEKVRHYLIDEPFDFTDKNGHQKGTGFVAWVSDYAIMSRYRNRLLDTNEEYYVYFASDEQGNKALEADLGTWDSISENGKTFSQAPISIYRDADGNFRLRVQDQFNGVI